MDHTEVHQCGCVICREDETDPEAVSHRHFNLVLSRLDEQQRRWVAACEARLRGWGGVEFVSVMTGLSGPTIRRGVRELEAGLADRPTDRVRLPGAGRKPLEKKILTWSET